MARNEVRIIGGKWRGRKLGFPPEQQLRPSLGRVRETLFNWLRERVIDSRCLDLYAGSGALGFEALSRGAGTVVLVDNNRRIADGLRDNAARLGATAECRVVCMTAERYLALPEAPWDVILLDPPFAATAPPDAYRRTVRTVLARILDAGALAPDGVVYLECPRATEYGWEHWQTLKHGTAGATQFGLVAPSRLATI